MSEIKEVVPAFYANRFYVTVNPNITRVTFCDQGTSEEIPHTSIIMTTDNALALASLIMKVAEENKTQHPDLYKAAGSS